MSQIPIPIAQHNIGADYPPFIIAEMSGNHNQSLERALAIIDAAAASGAHALKLQTYTADTMTLDVDAPGFRIDNPQSLWQGRSLYDLYNEAHTPWDWHAALFARCAEQGMVCLSTPFDASAVDFLEDLGAPAYKIASFETVDLPLIRKTAETGKPLIISTGMASLAEIDEAVRTVRETGNSQLILLQCTSTYPASPEASNLRTIAHMQQAFDVQVGLSDHTLGIGVALASVALGARVIEKHFTLSRADGGVDAAFSLEPEEMRALVQESRRAWQALGEVSYGVKAQEQGSLVFRRSLYISQDLRAGDVLTPENLRAIRPGYGLPPKYYTTLLGKRLAKDVRKGTPMHWDLLSD